MSAPCLGTLLIQIKTLKHSDSISINYKFEDGRECTLHTPFLSIKVTFMTDIAIPYKWFSSENTLHTYLIHDASADNSY